MPLLTSISTRFTALVTFLLLTAAAPAQSFAPVDQWLEQNAESLGGRAILVVCKDGQVVYNKSVNEMTRRQKIGNALVARRSGKEANLDAFTMTTRLPVASCSKWFSAALVMTFVDEGKLKLTDTVGQFLSILSKAGKGGITIDQCLSHRTGIKAPQLKESLQEMRDVHSMDEAIEGIAALPVEGEPGTVFHYSNIGLQIAGAVLEKISGKDFETLFAERIAGPLGMANTDFGKGRVALPAGGAQSTTGDYLRFLQMILGKGMYKGRRILGEESISQMQVNRITPGVRVAYSPAEAGNFGYGYGEWVMDPSTLSHLTKAVCSPGLFGAFPWVDHERGYCAFLLTYTIRYQGRHESYNELKALVDRALLP